MPRSLSDRLRRALNGGATIVIKGTNTKVSYQLRHSRDDKPWVDASGNRFNGHQVEARVT